MCFKFYKCTSCIVTKNNFKGTRFHFHTRLQKIGKPNCERDNQNLYIEKEQTTQWPKEKVNKMPNNDLQNIHIKTKDWVTRTPLKTGGELRCCSTSGTRRVNLVTNPVVSRKWGKDRELFTTSGTRWESYKKQDLLTLLPLMSCNYLK